MDSLQHRGPDAQGAWLSLNQRVALGHTRLSIIDLETGDQPITNETGRTHIIANGEFYDFERQRSELESLGHVFRTRSDSEIAIHLFEEFGTHCVQKLRGEFAFVLWDDLNQMLFAARDRFGIKPLYYAVYEDTIYDAMTVALSGRIFLDETVAATPEQVLRLIWEDHFILRPATAEPG